ncbi:MAG: hypothetical protein Ct9H300mP15_09430 [Gemmatimonadota bacterium]|nr:MAG: hypothetical protein Ct9H300mP15_09430 [Gemmatimonadota bacterium]
MGEFDLMTGLYVFVLATLAAVRCLQRSRRPYIPRSCQVPNAISGIAIVGAIIVAAKAKGQLSGDLGVIAIAMATINVIGGFMVTDGKCLPCLGRGRGNGQGYSVNLSVFPAILFFVGLKRLQSPAPSPQRE